MKARSMSATVLAISAIFTEEGNREQATGNSLEFPFLGVKSSRLLQVARARLGYKSPSKT